MYYLVYGLLYLVSLVPLRILYLLSDFAYFIVYYVAGYRKKTVMQNLTIAFPDKSEEEKKQIAKKFYRNFTDNFIETIKLVSAGEKFINKHFVADYSILHRLSAEEKKSQIHLGHNFNWELANLGVGANVRQKLLTVYMPIENKTFNKIFLKLRSKTGAVMLPATDMRNAILPWRKINYTLALVADQSPATPGNAYWVRFFGRPTAFLRAPENGARIGNLPVVFSHFIKIRRGYYQCFFVMGEENPALLQKGDLTKKYARYLEEVIAAHPDIWLWSHRRWKWEWKPEYGQIVE